MILLMGYPSRYSQTTFWWSIFFCSFGVKERSFNRILIVKIWRPTYIYKHDPIEDFLFVEPSYDFLLINVSFCFLVKVSSCEFCPKIIRSCYTIVQTRDSPTFACYVLDLFSSPSINCFIIPFLSLIWGSETCRKLPWGNGRYRNMAY